MEIIKTQPDETEISVKKVYPLRYAADGGREKYGQFFKGFNDAISKDPH